MVTTCIELRYKYAKADQKKYMSANEGMKLLLKMEEKIDKKLFNSESIVCVVARAGSDKPIIRAGAIKDLQKIDFGTTLHSIVIPGKLHFMEIEALMILAQLPAQQRGKLQKV